MSVGATPEEFLEGVSLGGGSVARLAMQMHADNYPASGLDKKSYMLARLAALVAVGADEFSFVSNVSAALDWGVTEDDIAGMLIAVMPMLGTALIVQAAPKIALAFDAIEE
jgi:4-carboxymuconolactone decarboxylase